EKVIMEIKCPICGKKYHYDRKICQECEDYSIYSGLAEDKKKTNHKWNCSIFLGIDTSAFKVSNTCELIKDLTPEPANLITKVRRIYDWNTEAINRINREIVSVPKKLTLGDYSMIKRYRSDASLLYE
ncbi:MAG: hypothetical protein ACFFDB_18635, partial [Promethearchaeota archaeon]